METILYSMTKNGLSVCLSGEENYMTFRPAHRPKQLYYQFDYRDKSGELFSTVALTLEQCREKRDKWVQAKNYKRLFPSTLKKIGRQEAHEMRYGLSNRASRSYSYNGNQLGLLFEGRNRKNVQSNIRNGYKVVLTNGVGIFPTPL